MKTTTPSVTKSFIPSIAVKDAKNTTESNQISDKLVSQHLANKTALL
ncbi:hypothetical protein [Arsenophonus endosymbiont of Aleurodicus floccissimus]|nr:hypothetical protein [Arsenophonus endosymbiont of Aleurodicus floccissimus]